MASQPRWYDGVLCSLARACRRSFRWGVPSGGWLRVTTVADVRLKSSEFDLGRLVSESDIEVRMTEFVPVHNSVVPYL